MPFPISHIQALKKNHGIGYDSHGSYHRPPRRK
jgi:hypothetical protein